jgi:hypothetical protein
VHRFEHIADGAGPAVPEDLKDLQLRRRRVFVLGTCQGFAPMKRLLLLLNP